MIWNQGKAMLEALLLAAPQPLSEQRLADVVGLEEKEIRHLLSDLQQDYQGPARGLVLQEVAGGWRLTTKPEYAELVAKLLSPRPARLSAAALETLAIIAYKQPVTRPEVEAMRGVGIDHSLATLLERNLVREIGRKDAPGRPILYGTTEEFLQHFGLPDLTHLPPLAENENDPGLILRRREPGEGEQSQLEEVS